MTVREFTSKITNKLKALGINDWISSKFLHIETKQIIADFVKKDNSQNRLLFKINDAFTEIEGVPMIKIDSTKCEIGTFECDHFMRTKEELPPIYMSKFGPLVTQVMSINLGMTYKNCNTARQWKAIEKREFDDGVKYYFFVGNHLFIPVRKATEVSPEEIRILAMFKDKYQVQKYREKVGTCEECKKVDSCKRPLDYELVIPSYLEDDVESKLMIDLANIYLKVIPSEAENLNPNDKNSQRDLENRKIQA